MSDLYHQYNQQSDSNTASPVGSSLHQTLDQDSRLKSQVYTLTSQVEVLARELNRTRARLRDLESNLSTVVAALRRDS